MSETYTEGDLSVLGHYELDSLVNLIHCYRDGTWEEASEIIFNKLYPQKITFGYNSNSGYLFIITEDHNAFVIREEAEDIVLKEEEKVINYSNTWLEWHVTCEGCRCNTEGFITDAEFSKLRKKILKNYELPSKILCDDCLGHSRKDKK